MNRVCQQCGKSFNISPAIVARGGGKFCSNACFGASISTSQTYACVVCGTFFTAKPSERAKGNAKYCSRQCSYIGAQKGQVQQCPQCGREYYPRHPDNKYCSMACYAQGQRVHVAHICGQCGSEFIVRGRGKRQFCSTTCLHEHRRNSLAPFHDEIKRLYLEESQTIYDIGKRFGVAGTVIQDRLARMGVTRRNHRERTAQLIASGRIRGDNSLEREMCGIFDELSIKYQHGKRIGYYAFDFYLPDFNALLECDGTFWHADPRFFPDRDNLYDVQKRGVVNDRRKSTFATNKGYLLLRFWEHDIRNDRAMVIDRLRELCATGS